MSSKTRRLLHDLRERFFTKLQPEIAVIAAVGERPRPFEADAHGGMERIVVAAEPGRAARAKRERRLRVSPFRPRRRAGNFFRSLQGTASLRKSSHRKKYRSGGTFSGGRSGGIKTFAGRSFRIIAERRSTIKPTYSHFLVDNAPLLWISFAPRFQKSARLRQNRADFPHPASCALCISPPTINLSRQAGRCRPLSSVEKDGTDRSRWKSLPQPAGTEKNARMIQ